MKLLKILVLHLPSPGPWALRGQGPHLSDLRCLPRAELKAGNWGGLSPCLLTERGHLTPTVGLASRDRWNQTEAANLIALESCLKMSTNTTAQRGHLLELGVRPCLLCSAASTSRCTEGCTVGTFTRAPFLILGPTVRIRRATVSKHFRECNVGPLRSDRGLLEQALTTCHYF